VSNLTGAFVTFVGVGDAVGVVVEVGGLPVAAGDASGVVDGVLVGLAGVWPVAVV
jgi:hypothetical protein